MTRDLRDGDVPWSPWDRRPPTIDEVVDLARAYYALPDNCTGGNFHIVLDDGNVDDTDVAWCQGLAHGRGDTAAGTLGSALSRLTVDEREQVYARYGDYFRG